VRHPVTPPLGAGLRSPFLLFGIALPAIGAKLGTLTCNGSARSLLVRATHFPSGSDGEQQTPRTPHDECSSADL